MKVEEIRSVTGMDRLERELDLALLESEFDRVGVTKVIAVDGVWKAESEAIRKALVSRLCEDAQVFDVFQQLVRFGAVIRGQSWDNGEPYENQEVDIMLADVKHFFDSAPKTYGLSESDHADIMRLVREAIQTAVTQLLCVDGNDGSVDVFLSEGKAMSIFRQAAPASSSYYIVSPQQEEWILDLLQKGIDLSMFDAFPNLLRFAVKNAKGRFLSLCPASTAKPPIQIVWRKA